MRIRHLLVLLATLVALLVPIGVASPAGACAFLNRQYVVNADTLTLRDTPGGAVKATLYRGDLFNSRYEPSDTWLGGNAYRRGSEAYVGQGYVLRQYLSYTGRSWC